MENQWTKERTEDLIRRWQAGQTVTAIAKVFNTTRGAVIGKLDRMGVERLPGKPVITLPKISV